MPLLPWLVEGTQVPAAQTPVTTERFAAVCHRTIVWPLAAERQPVGSLLLDTVPLADPLVTLQSLASGHLPELSLLLGAAIVALGYGLLGGRVFCSWVCPVNLVTDTAAWLRRKFGLPRLPELPRSLRYYLLVLVLLLPH